MNPIEAALALTECISDPMFLVDSQGVLIGANSPAAALAEISKSEIPGKPLSSLVDDHGLNDTLARWRRCRDPMPGVLHFRSSAGLRDLKCEGSALPLNGSSSPSLIAIRCRDQVQSVQGFQSLEAKIQALGREIRERQRAEEALRESEQRLRGIFEHASDAILVADDTGLLVEANPAACELIGRPLDELANTRVADLTKLEFAGQARDEWEQFMQQGLQTGVFTIERPDGSTRQAEYSAVRDFVRGRHLSILRDVTERQRYAAERERQSEALARSNAELEQFAYIASHDLQEPLRTINSFVELARRHLGDSVDADTAEYFGVVKDAVRRLQRIILDLIEFTNLARRSRPFQKVDLNELMIYLRRELAASLLEANATLTTEPLPSLQADPAQMTQLFANLIDNAIKFNPEASAIRIGVEHREGEPVIAVEDNGPGIEPQYAERIFEPFRRLCGQEIPGSGIGLAICKRIAENHGGRIWVEPGAQGGCKFVIALPALAGSSAASTAG